MLPDRWTCLRGGAESQGGVKGARGHATRRLLQGMVQPWICVVLFSHLLREGSKKLGPALAGWVAGERFGVGLVALGADRSGIKLWVLR